MTLRALAEQIAECVPADEVVLTGSVARGTADAYSDVELLLVVSTLPSIEDAQRSARSAGVEPTSPWRSDELVYVAGETGATLVELLWLEAPRIDELIDRAFAGDLVDHSRLRALEAIEHGVSLRGGERLVRWQERLTTYPEPLRGRLIRDAVDDWGGYAVTAYTRQAWRSDRYALVRVVLEVVDDILRLLFAVNRRWEPSWKRIPELVGPLPLKPPRTAERIDAALTEPDSRVAMLRIFQLARDAVALVEPELDVARARTWLDAAVEALR